MPDQSRHDRDPKAADRGSRAVDLVGVDAALISVVAACIEGVLQRTVPASLVSFLR